MSELDARGGVVLCMGQLYLSARAYYRILKLARTLADMAGSEEIQSAHLAEALHPVRAASPRGETAFGRPKLYMM